MRSIKRGTGIILSMLMLTGAQIQAQTTGELLQQGLYAEEIEGNLPEAIVSYEKIVNDASASPKHKAQALYHQGICFIRLDDVASAQTALSRLVNDYADQTALIEKAKPLLDKIKIFDPAAVMPADTLVYLELGNIGGQIETIFEILIGTPLEDPLQMIAQSDPDALRDGIGPVLAGLLNPAMKEDFIKIRSLAVGMVDLSSDQPELVAALHLGESTMLRGLLLTALSIAATPGPAVEGVPTYSIEGQVEIACDGQALFLSFPPGRLPEMIQKYKHLSSEASLASGNSTFTAVNKTTRQKNLATLWVNTDDLYSRLVPHIDDVQIQIAGGTINVESIDDLMLSLAFTTNSIGIDGRIRLKEGQSNMICDMFRTPSISSKGLKAVPADAVGLLSLNLPDSNSTAMMQLRQLLKENVGMDLPAELIDSLGQITLFVLPYENMTEQLAADVPGHLGMVIECNAPSLVTPFVESIKPMLAEQELFVEIVDGTIVLSALNSVAMDAVKAVLKGAPSVADQGILNAKVKEYAENAEKLALINARGIVRWAGADSISFINDPVVTEEMKQQLVDSYEKLADTLASVNFSLSTDELDSELCIQAELDGIPNVNLIIEAVRGIIQAEEKAAQVVNQARRQMEEEERQKELELRAERLAKLVPTKVARTATAPTIDGEMDEIWKQSDLVPVLKWETATSDVLGKPLPDSEFAAAFRTLWDAENFYFYLYVTDNTPNKNSELDWYFNDNAILYIDATDAKSNSQGATDYQFIFKWDESEPIMTENTHGKMNGITYKIRNTDKGYCIEAAFPWKTLGTLEPGVGTTIGMDVHVSDNQTGSERNAQIGWQDDTDNAWQYPYLWGRAVITEEGK
jgi:hypothetical protein